MQWQRTQVAVLVTVLLVLECLNAYFFHLGVECADAYRFVEHFVGGDVGELVFFVGNFDFVYSVEGVDAVADLRFGVNIPALAEQFYADWFYFEIAFVFSESLIPYM